MNQHQKGFVYIFSNQEYPGKFKIGKTKDNPVIRAKTLTKQTGAIGEFIVEWEKEVPDMNIAESILHYKFREYHFEKEFFEFDLEETKIVAKKTLDNFFTDDILKAELKAAEIEAEKMMKEMEEIEAAEIEAEIYIKK